MNEWILCNERLPENSKHKGAFCPKYLVMTKYGIGEGWYNPDKECWYGLFWFMTTDYVERNIDMQRGDVPKVIKNAPVVAWMPFPKRLERLSGDFNRGYTKAIQDIIKVFDNIQQDLRHYHKNLTAKLSRELLQCCLTNRENIRENIGDGFVRYNGKEQSFEYYKPERSANIE